jgi:hypothetical protein
MRAPGMTRGCLTFRLSPATVGLMALDDDTVLREAFPSLTPHEGQAWAGNVRDVYKLRDELASRGDPRGGWDHSAPERAVARRAAANLSRALEAWEHRFGS